MTVKRNRELVKADLEKIAESVPFAFSTKRNVQELRPAAIAYVTNLRSLLFRLLDDKDR